MGMAQNSPPQTFKNKNLAKLIWLVAIVLLIVVIWAWWHYVRSNPERTFYAAINNSLRTSSVTKEVTQKAPGQNLEQQVELTLSPQHVARGRTTISQEGETSATVQTETVSTSTEDYVRYTDIVTNQKDKSGKVLNFTELLNIWGKTESNQLQAGGELYGESTLGIVPIGDLPAGERTSLMDFIRDNNVYEFDEAKVERKIEDGRPVYVYDVTVAPEAWVGMLKQFAKAVGLKQLEAIDPASYKEAQAITLKLSVDVWGRQLVGVAYQGGERTERLGSYGIWRDTTIPEKTIPVQELQQRLQSIQ